MGNEYNFPCLPDMCMCGDEVRNNISIKGDRHAGGELLLTAKKSVGQRKCSARNQKSTLIGLTAFSGEPAMCVIIVEGKLPNGAIEAGIDITVTLKGSIDDPDFIFNNNGNGSYDPGGPEYVHLQREESPCTHTMEYESANITTRILLYKCIQMVRSEYRGVLSLARSTSTVAPLTLNLINLGGVP